MGVLSKSVFLDENTQKANKSLERDAYRTLQFSVNAFNRKSSISSILYILDKSVLPTKLDYHDITDISNYQ